MPQQQGSTKERVRLREPGKYDVVFINDDFTPMDLVVIILMQVFFKSYTEAEDLMMKVHTRGRAVAGSYTLDIARSKADRAIAIARDNGFPLRVEVVGTDDLPF